MYWVLALFGAATTIYFSIYLMMTVDQALDTPHRTAFTILTIAYLIYGITAFRIGLFHIRKGRDAMLARWNYWLVGIAASINLLYEVWKVIGVIANLSDVLMIGRLNWVPVLTFMLGKIVSMICLTIVVVIAHRHLSRPAAATNHG